MSWVGTAVALGTVGSAAGAGMQASSASAARKQARDAANLPGINIGSVLGESSLNAPRAREMEAERNWNCRASIWITWIRIDEPWICAAGSAESRR